MEQLDNPLPSTNKNPTGIFVEESSMAPTEKFQEKIKLAESEVIAKFHSLQVNKCMADFLEVQLQVGREKLENVQVEFEQINNATLKVEEKVATKATDKMTLVKYNNRLGEGTLKAICTMEQVHTAFQSKEPASLGLEPCVCSGN
jgi:hypothetical protein